MFAYLLLSAGKRSGWFKITLYNELILAQSISSKLPYYTGYYYWKQSSEFGSKGPSCYICGTNLSIGCILFIVIYIVVDKPYCVCALKFLSPSLNYFSSISRPLAATTLPSPFSNTPGQEQEDIIVGAHPGLHVPPSLGTAEELTSHPISYIEQKI